jgi:hypothetical protein
MMGAKRALILLTTIFCEFSYTISACLVSPFNKTIAESLEGTSFVTIISEGQFSVFILIFNKQTSVSVISKEMIATQVILCLLVHVS